MAVMHFRQLSSQLQMLNYNNIDTETDEKKATDRSNAFETLVEPVADRLLGNLLLDGELELLPP